MTAELFFSFARMITFSFFLLSFFDVFVVTFVAFIFHWLVCEFAIIFILHHLREGCGWLVNRKM